MYLCMYQTIKYVTFLLNTDDLNYANKILRLYTYDPFMYVCTYVCMYECLLSVCADTFEQYVEIETSIHYLRVLFQCIIVRIIC